MQKNKPVQMFRLGRIKAAIWANQKQGRNWYTITVSRSYRDEHGGWQDTGGFTLSDIPLVSKVLEHAYTYLYDLQRQVSNAEECGDAVGAGSVPCDAADEIPAVSA